MPFDRGMMIGVLWAFGLKTIIAINKCPAIFVNCEIQTGSLEAGKHDQ